MIRDYGPVPDYITLDFLKQAGFVDGKIRKRHITLNKRLSMFDLLRAIAFSHSTEYEFREFLRQYHERLSLVYGVESVNAEQAMSVASEVLDAQNWNESLNSKDVPDNIPILKPEHAENT